MPASTGPGSNISFWEAIEQEASDIEIKDEDKDQLEDDEDMPRLQVRDRLHQLGLVLCVLNGLSDPSMAISPPAPGGGKRQVAFREMISSVDADVRAKMRRGHAQSRVGPTWRARPLSLRRPPTTTSRLPTTAPWNMRLVLRMTPTSMILMKNR